MTGRWDWNVRKDCNRERSCSHGFTVLLHLLIRQMAGGSRLFAKCPVLHFGEVLFCKGRFSCPVGQQMGVDERMIPNPVYTAVALCRPGLRSLAPGHLLLNQVVLSSTQQSCDFSVHGCPVLYCCIVAGSSSSCAIRTYVYLHPIL